MKHQSKILTTLAMGGAGAAIMALAKNQEALLDSAKMDATYDPAVAAAAAAAFTAKDLKMNAAASVQEWVETGEADLEDGEGMGDRLVALLIGIADANMDGEIGDDEADVAQAAMDEAYSYMMGKGVAAEDLDAIFNGDDAAASNAAADRAKEFLASVMPEGAEGSMDDLDSFVFSEADEAPALDSTGSSLLDAAYRRVVAIRQGKKTFVHKRISGTVRLTGKQKMSIRKAGMKAHSSQARMRRAKSMRISRSMGLGR